LTFGTFVIATQFWCFQGSWHVILTPQNGLFKKHEGEGHECQEGSKSINIG